MVLAELFIQFWSLFHMHYFIEFHSLDKKIHEMALRVLDENNSYQKSQSDAKFAVH